MALDFIGVGGRGGEEGDWLAVEEGLVGDNPSPGNRRYSAGDGCPVLCVPSWRGGGSAATIIAYVGLKIS